VLINIVGLSFDEKTQRSRRIEKGLNNKKNTDFVKT